MEYRDECIAVDLPEGFAFHDRPNYCSWNFTHRDSLIAVRVLTRERISGIERSIRNTRTIPGLGYVVSGPHELQLEHCSAVYIESVVETPGKFYNKQTQIVLRYADFAVLVVINRRSHYEVPDTHPFLKA